MYGYAGKLLRVNLSEETVSEELVEEDLLKKFIGGTGIGAKILYDEVSSDVEWFAPQNLLIIASGPLSGTIIPGSGTVSVITKGPLTNGATSTQANGRFGAFLKSSGFDGIIIKGVSDKWVYLYIENGKAELRDANDLKGKGTYKTVDLIREKHNKKEYQISVASIGPAGENLVRFAAIFIDKGHVAAHNGPGAVMGSKKLKAIAVARGKMQPLIYDRERLRAIANEILEDARNTGVYHEGTIGGFQTIKVLHHLPVKNYTTNIWVIDDEKLKEWSADYISRIFKKRKNPCWACQANHCNFLIIQTSEGVLEIEEPEYEALAAWGPLIDNKNVVNAILLSYETDDLGMDVNEASWIISWLMECYEKGILKREDLNGIDMRWGDCDAVRKMLRLIATRDGIGDLLAQGIKRASSKIGGEAKSLAIYTLKGNTPRAHDHRVMQYEMFDTCVSNTGTIETHLMQLGFKKYLQPCDDPLEMARIVAETKGIMLFEDSLGTCRFNTQMNLKRLTEAVNAVTGWSITPEEAKMIGLRIVNLLRAFNIKQGHTPDLEYPSPRYGSPIPDGPFKGITIIPYWDQMLDIYYKTMQWDRNTGKPLPETLKKLGLDYIIKDLWR